MASRLMCAAAGGVRELCGGANQPREERHTAALRRVSRSSGAERAVRGQASTACGCGLRNATGRDWRESGPQSGAGPRETACRVRTAARALRRTQAVGVGVQARVGVCAHTWVWARAAVGAHTSRGRAGISTLEHGRRRRGDAGAVRQQEAAVAINCDQ